MNIPIDPNSRWSTASIDTATDTTPMELSALGEHLSTCHGDRGRLFGLRVRAEAMHGFVAARFVTTLCVLTLLLIGLVQLVT
jgi:hypothetical protein